MKKAEDKETEKSLTERIYVDPEIKHGKPVIKGTRIPIEVVLESLAGSMDIENVCEEHGLEKEDVYAAIDYVRRRISGEEVTPMEV